LLAVLVAGCAAVGLTVGWGLNVVIYRVPRRLPVLSPGSACPSCHTAIAVRDNVPLVSWLLLRARCRHCRAPISLRYPLVEVATAALFAATAGRLGFDWALPAYLVAVAGLLGLACIDVEHLLLPKKLVYPVLGAVALLLVLAAAATGRWHDLWVAAASAAAWFAIFFIVNASNPRLLGFGDVRLAPLLGLSLGWLGVRYVLLGFFAANLVGAAVGLALVAAGRISRRQPIPFGVFLAIGTAIALFAGPELLRPFRLH
jgi:leader peptidase (prepilin peptidase) / N-methyltransferase